MGEVVAQKTESPQPRMLSGTPVMPGIAYAPVVWSHRPQLPSMDAGLLSPRAQREQRDVYETACQAVANRLHERAAVTIGHASDVLSMLASLVEDRGLHKEVCTFIDQGVPGEQAVVLACEKYAELFAKMGGIMAERVEDLRDVRDRIIAQMRGQREPGIPHVDQPSILFASTLAPADAAGLDPEKIIAVATRQGGPTSHSAIITRQLGIPSIVAAKGLRTITDGTWVLLDGEQGVIYQEPDASWARARMETHQRWRREVAAWRGPGRTACGMRVELLANVQDGSTARTAVAAGAEGVGLVRSELCYLASQYEPTIEEQRAEYAPVFEAFPGKKVVVRTLDAGSDKPLPFAGLPEEENPALGVRGLRAAFTREDMLDRQLDAIALAARGHGEVARVMAPMVSTPGEAQWFAGKVRARNMLAGVMVEVPAMAILIERFLPEVDFISIGTNDLTQYVMAADRLSSDLAEYTDPWQVAALTLTAHVCKECVRAGVPVSVCGEAAADPLLACVLVGMGARSLSMASSALSLVGATLERVTIEACEKAAAEVLQAHSPSEARARARAALALPRA